MTSRRLPQQIQRLILPTLSASCLAAIYAQNYSQETKSKETKSPKTKSSSPSSPSSPPSQLTENSPTPRRPLTSLLPLQPFLPASSLASCNAHNVMLQHRRSRLSRDLEAKYRPEWTNRLGEGAYGSVHIAHQIEPAEKVALKKVREEGRWFHEINNHTHTHTHTHTHIHTYMYTFRMQGTLRFIHFSYPPPLSPLRFQSATPTSPPSSVRPRLSSASTTPAVTPTCAVSGTCTRTAPTST